MRARSAPPGPSTIRAGRRRRRGGGRLPHRSRRRLRGSHPRHAAAAARDQAPRRRRLDERRRARLDEPVRRGRLEVQRRHRRGGGRGGLRRDHVRLRTLPTDGDVRTAVYDGKRREHKTVTIAKFVEYARPWLEPLGARVSAAVFGPTATREMGIGQRPSLLAKHLDVIYPMVYPPTSAPVSTRRTIPTRFPASPSPGRCATSGATCAAGTLLVPWLQDFSLAATTPSRTSARRSSQPGTPRAPGSSCGTRAACTRRPPFANARPGADFHRDAHSPIRDCGKCGKMNFPQIASRTVSRRACEAPGAV